MPISRREFLGGLGATLLSASCADEKIGSPRKPRVLVVGGGMAGLAAGITLLENGGREKYDVTLLTMGHKLGGKVSSWKNAQGFRVGHGLHGIYGFYTEMPRLLQDAGVDRSQELISNDGVLYWYEESNGKVNQLQVYADPVANYNEFMRYEGFSKEQKDNILAFELNNAYTLVSDPHIDRLDDISFANWALKAGLMPSVVDSRLMRYSRDAAFNYPSEVSAYIAIKFLRELGGLNFRHTEYYMPNGGWAEHVINPLGRYFERLGGRIVYKTKLLNLLHDTRRIVGVEVATPDPGAHHAPNGTLPRRIPPEAGTQTVLRGYDHYVSTLPIDSVRELNAGDAFLWEQPYFAQIAKLKTIATLSFTLWLREGFGTKYSTVINGLAEPMPYAADYKQMMTEYKNDARFGAVLDFVGQETGFEDWTDEEIAGLVLDNFAAIEGHRDLRDCGILHSSFRRNASNHARYLLTEPGHLKYRPQVESPFENLFLAGDWIRSDLDIPSMEAAMRTGIRAAKLIKG